MRPTFLAIFIILLLGIVAGATTTTTNSQSFTNDLFQKILYYVANMYNYIVSAIQGFLQATLLKEDPGLASTYANIIAVLIPATAIYIILTFVEVVRRILGYIIILGWAFILIVMLLASH